jgi:hypothetical protein
MASVPQTPPRTYDELLAELHRRGSGRKALETVVDQAGIEFGQGGSSGPVHGKSIHGKAGIGGECLGRPP